MPVVGRTAAPAAQHGHSWLWVRDRARCARLSGTTEIDSIFKQPILRPSLRANGSRERAPDDRLSEAIHSQDNGNNGLLRRFRLRLLSYGGQVAPRNDVAQISNTTPHSRGAMRPGFARTVRTSINRGRRESRGANAPAASRSK